MSLSCELAYHEKFAAVLPQSNTARTVFDLSTEERTEIEKRMMPGAWSEVGFLRMGDRLLSVCVEDGFTLLNANVPCYMIADVLSGIVAAAQKSHFRYPIIAGKFKVTNARVSTVGYQECPFSPSENKSCHIGRNDAEITNIHNGISIVANDLTIEMIRNHFFFQSGPYRIAPQAAIKCLELETTKYERVTEKFAKVLEFENLNAGEEEVRKFEEEKKISEKYAAPIFIAPGVVGYVLPYKNRTSYENHGLTVEQKIRKECALQGLTEEEIEAKLDFKAWFGKFHCPPRTREEMLSEVIQREEKEGDQFLHIFNDRDRKGDEIIYEFNGYKLDRPIKYAGNCILELTEKTYVPFESEASTQDQAPPQKKRRANILDPYDCESLLPIES